MRKFLLFVAVMVVVAGLGIYLGWIGFATAKDSETGRTVVQLSFGQPK
jgi:hypothetical protein